MGIMLTYVAGVPYRPGSSERLASMVPGEELTLAPEPTNAFDKKAVAVYDGGFHLGYVPALDNPTVNAAMERGLPVRALYRGDPGKHFITIQYGEDVK